jgi:hypothetical protein
MEPPVAPAVLARLEVLDSVVEPAPSPAAPNGPNGLVVAVDELVVEPVPKLQPRSGMLNPIIHVHRPRLIAVTGSIEVGQPHRTKRDRPVDCWRSLEERVGVKPRESLRRRAVPPTHRDTATALTEWA